MIDRKRTAQGVCFMNEQQPNSQEYKDWSGWQRRKTQLLWPMLPSTQRIGKDTRASPYLFPRRAADVISEACFTAITEDRHDEPAVLDLSIIAVALTPSWLMNFNSYASLAILFIIPVLFCFVFEHEIICTTRVSALFWFLLPYVSLQSNWVWKPSKLGMSISFSLRIFVSVYVIITPITALDMLHTFV